MAIKRKAKGKQPYRNKNFRVYWIDGKPGGPGVVRKSDFEYESAAKRFARKHNSDVYPT